MNNFNRELCADPFSEELRDALLLRDSDALKAYEEVGRLPEKGSPLANMVLGQAYVFGHRGLQKNGALAEELLSKASSLGSLEGSFELARWCRLNGHNEKATMLYESLSTSDFPVAPFVLGLSYVQGNFTETDMRLGRSYLETAAHKGHLHAQDWLAHLESESDVSLYRILKAVFRRFRLKKQIEELQKSDPHSDLIRIN